MLDRCIDRNLVRSVLVLIISVASSLTSGVVAINSSGFAFAALKSNGSVVAWGDAASGGSTTSPVNAASYLICGISSAILSIN